MNTFSIIIPVYQVEPYISRCLDSILKQVTNDVQILIIDDGSTDKSGIIADSYATKYSQIQVIHQENYGVAKARNVGLDFATGAYIAWVDPDDWVSDDWFSSIQTVIKTHNPDVIIFDSVYVFDNKQKNIVYGESEGFVQRDIFIHDIAKDIRMFSGFPNKVIKASAFNEIRLDENLHILEDYNSIIDILLNIQTVYYIPKLLYYYFQNPNSLIHSNTPELAFRSVEIALARQNKVSHQFKKSALIGVMIQAFMYCRTAETHKEYKEQTENYKICKNIIKKNLCLLLKDTRIPFNWKLKFILARFNILQIILRIKARDK